jgi:hypothetical protein
MGIELSSSQARSSASAVLRDRLTGAGRLILRAMRGIDTKCHASWRKNCGMQALGSS